jgi:phosphatidate cytidylyltransferase
MIGDAELRLRVITGILLGLVVIAATTTGLIPAVSLVTVIVLVSSLEFFQMQRNRNGNQNAFVPALLCVLPVLLLVYNVIRPASIDFFQSPVWIIVVIALSFMCYFLTRIKSGIAVLEHSLFSFGLSTILFTIPGILAVSLCMITPKLLLGIFILLWSSDVFAYFGGRLVGRHKLLPSISPKKTWEGFGAGLIATGVVAWGLTYLLPEINTIDWIITGILVVIFGVLGDFLQSTMKRGAGVKDSGRLLPGHGGMWDRFDSFLGCIPWVGAYHLLM